MSRSDYDDWLWKLGIDFDLIHKEIASTKPRFAHSKAWQPKIDLIETPEYLLVRVEISGVKNEDLRIFFIPQRPSLIIKGSRNEEDLSRFDQARYHQLEIFFGDFEREVVLPNIPIRPETMRALFRNGFLLIYIPKDTEKIDMLTIETVYTIKHES